MHTETEPVWPELLAPEPDAELLANGTPYTLTPDDTPLAAADHSSEHEVPLPVELVKVALTSLGVIAVADPLAGVYEVVSRSAGTSTT